MENKNQEILWEAKPQYKFRWAFVELLSETSLGFLMIFILAGIIFLIYQFVTISIYEDPITKICSLLLALGIMFGIELHKNKRRKKTFYRASADTIYIDDYWYGTKIFHEIHFSDIDKIYLVNFMDDIGEIHLFTEKEYLPKTRNFWSGLERHHPTLEDIPQAKKNYEELSLLFKAYQATQDPSK